MDFDNSLDIITPDLQPTLTIGGTGALVVPSGTTAQRPTAANGMLRYNSDSNALEVVTGGTYQPVAVGPVGTVSVGEYTTYYFQATASDIATHKQMLTAPYGTPTTLTTANVVTAQILANFTTDPSIPKLTSIPAGEYELFVTADMSAGARTTTLYMELWETTSAGVDIALIGTTSYCMMLNVMPSEYYLTLILASAYTMASINSRICARLRAYVVGTGGAPTIDVFYGGAVYSSGVRIPRSDTAISINSVQQNLGTVPKSNGNFTIPGTGFTPGKQVWVSQGLGPYTGKGSIADEIEMDQIMASGYVTNSTTIQVNWGSGLNLVMGYYQFNYQIGA